MADHGRCSPCGDERGLAVTVSAAVRKRDRVAYEKEVRLLVDLQQARDTGKSDSNGWPIKAIDPPPDAIKEIYRGANTKDADVERAVEVARGDNKRGLFVGHVSSHAFRIQKTGGLHH